MKANPFIPGMSVIAAVMIDPKYSASRARGRLPPGSAFITLDYKPPATPQQELSERDFHGEVLNQKRPLIGDLLDHFSGRLPCAMAGTCFHPNQNRPAAGLSLL